MTKLKTFIAGATLALLPGCAAALECTVSATPVVFGVYNPVSGATAASNGTVSITCGKGPSASYTIAMTTGTAGTYTPRAMASGSNQLRYNLYTDLAYSRIWGNGTAGTFTVSDSMSIRPGPKTVTKQYGAYGLIPARQLAHIGSYTDGITVTVTF